MLLVVDGIGDVVQRPALGQAKDGSHQAWVKAVGKIGEPGLPQHRGRDSGTVEDMGGEGRRDGFAVPAGVAGGERVRVAIQDGGARAEELRQGGGREWVEGH